MGFPGGSDGKESTCNAGDPGSIPGSGRSPGEGHGYPLQYFCLENPWTEEPGGLQMDKTEKLTFHFQGCDQGPDLFPQLLLPWPEEWEAVTSLG